MDYSTSAPLNDKKIVMQVKSVVTLELTYSVVLKKISILKNLKITCTTSFQGGGGGGGAQLLLTSRYGKQSFFFF